MYGKKEYLSYPFLYEEKSVVEFELLTDEISSLIGHAASFCEFQELNDELIKVSELVYHLNPCIRTKTTITEDEVLWLQSRYVYYLESTKDRDTLFVLPSGGKTGSTLHLVRCKSKQLVRLMYKLKADNERVDEVLFDFANVLANYAFTASLYANKLEGFSEIPFRSRIYK